MGLANKAHDAICLMRLMRFWIDEIDEADLAGGATDVPMLLLSTGTSALVLLGCSIVLLLLGWGAKALADCMRRRSHGLAPLPWPPSALLMSC